MSAFTQSKIAVNNERLTTSRRRKGIVQDDNILEERKKGQREGDRKPGSWATQMHHMVELLLSSPHPHLIASRE